MQPQSLRRRVVAACTDATTLTLLLTAALGGAGAVLAAHAPPAALLEGAPGGWVQVALLAGFAVAFVVAELGQALVEVRSSAYSFSLSGVPLLLGLLFLPPSLLLAVRVGAAVLTFAAQRSAPLKFGYNSASYLLDTALVVVVSHRLVGGPGALDVRTALLCYLALAVVDLLMSSCVLLVIRINQGPLERGDVAEVLLPAAGFVAVNTAIALVCALLLSSGWLGAALLVFFVVVTAGAYRAYLRLRGRHQSLQEVQDFVTSGEGAASAAELVEGMVEQIRALVHGRTAELVGEPSDPVLRRLAEQQEPRLIAARTADAQAAAWLTAQGAQEAVVVPVEDRGDGPGAVVVLDRVGDASTFTDDDLALVTTLARHLSVALQSRRLVERLGYEARHDGLTGLPNRSLLAERLAGSATDRAPVVLLLDLDNFKEVNDAFGHHVGDELLRVVAARLLELVPAEATVARLGGDEFAVLLPAAGSETAAEAAAMDVAAAIVHRLAQPADLPEITVTTAASIGVAVGAVAQGHDDLLRQADTAMYAAKESGRPVLYTPDLDRGRAERLAMLADLRRAIEREELQVHYQPKYDLTFGVVTGVEALVRWTHPVLGPLRPDVFVPLAESTGLVDQLTRLVLARALDDCRSWQDAGTELTVAVNLSARNISDPGLPDLVAAELARAGLPAHRLVLEITESSIMDDPARTVPTLERLRDIGVTLSLDDFGTGYSSLSYLQRLPVRELKIDRSFVLGLSDADDRHASEALVRAIISMSSALGLRIVAEGVETGAALEELQQLGCHVIQGYHLSRPVPAAALPAAVRRAEEIAALRRVSAS